MLKSQAKALPAPSGVVQVPRLSSGEGFIVLAALDDRVRSLTELGVIHLYFEVVALRDRFIDEMKSQGSELLKVSPSTKAFRGAGEPAAGKAEDVGLTLAPGR